MTPGPIAINGATFVGIKIAGLPGAFVATLGCITPSCIIVTLLAWLYMKYRNLSAMQLILTSLRPAVVAMIASAGITILTTALWNSQGTVHLATTNWYLVGIFVICLILLQKYKLNPIWVMLLAGVMKLGLAILGIA